MFAGCHDTQDLLCLWTSTIWSIISTSLISKTYGCLLRGMKEAACYIDEVVIFFLLLNMQINDSVHYRWWTNSVDMRIIHATNPEVELRS